MLSTTSALHNEIPCREGDTAGQLDLDITRAVAVSVTRNNGIADVVGEGSELPRNSGELVGADELERLVAARDAVGVHVLKVDRVVRRAEILNEVACRTETEIAERV